MPTPKPTTWTIELNWYGYWIVVAGGFKTQGDAEWAIAGWYQINKCFAEQFGAKPFRVVEV